MEVLYNSPQSAFAAQYGRSPHDYQSATGHLGDDGDRSRHSSSSFGTSMELSPPEIAMEFEGSDIDWSILVENSDTTSPMSNNLPDQDMFTWGHNVSQPGSAIDISAPSRATSIGTLPPALSPHRPHPQRPMYHSQNSAPATIPGAVAFNEAWNLQGRQNAPEIKFETTFDEDPVSASSLSPQGSLWSNVGQARFNPIPGAPQTTFSDSLDTYATSYPNSILSIDSSPQIQGIRTPSSTKSPQFSQISLQTSSLGSSGYASSHCVQHNHDHQQTPRARQNDFNQMHHGGLAYDLRGLDPVPQQSMDPYGNHAKREPTLSPSSEYLFVESTSETTATSVPRKSRYSKPQPPSPVGQSSRDFVFEEYPPAVDTGKRRSSDLVMRKSRDGKRAGGRSLGMHLPPDKAARAKQLRDEGSCWICCLQRDSCTPGEVCDRCTKRNQRAQMENGLGCDRTKLTELRTFFFPDILTRMGDGDVLKSFVNKHIRRWTGDALKIKMNIIWGLPAMDLELYEFEPKTNELLRQIFYTLNQETGKREWVQKNSPPLAMVCIENVDRQKYDRYLNKVVDHNLDRFAERCFKGEKDDFQARLFKLMIRLEPEAKDERALLHDIFRLQVVTYIYARIATVAPSQLPILHNLHYSNQHREIKYGRGTSLRMVNRQLKFLYCALFSQIMEGVLKRLQQILRSSRGGAKWTSAFVALLGLAMCFEEVQRTAHTNQDAEVCLGLMSDWEASQNAEAACRLIDEKFGFVANLFRWKYHRGFNPLKDLEDQKVQNTLGASALEFVKGVAGLVHEKHDFLHEKQHIPILKKNQDKYTSRLVARFLLAFWGPTTS